MADPIETRAVSRRTVLKGVAGVAGLATRPGHHRGLQDVGRVDRAERGRAERRGPERRRSERPAAERGRAAACPSAATTPTPASQGGMDGRSTRRSPTETGIAVDLNKVDHGTFQDQITAYLGGTPDTRLHVVLRVPHEVLRGPGPATPRSTTSGRRSRTTTPRASPSRVVGNDGKVYGIPVDYYPWAVFYRKSLFTEKGYTVPKTWDELKALSTKMQADGLTPIAFGDKDGWPAMGTFDILNLRQNGYDFHVDLMAGKEKWTDPKVTTVFQKWAEIVPFHAKDYAGLTWQNAADTLVQKKSGMYLLGLFVSAQFQATKDPADLEDLDFFPFPTLGTAVRRRERARRADRHLADLVEVAEAPGRAGRRQGVHGVLVEGLDPGASCSRTSRA